MAMHCHGRLPHRQRALGCPFGLFKEVRQSFVSASYG